MARAKRALSVELPGRSFSKRERRTRYWRRWSRRQKIGVRCFYVEIDLARDQEILVELGFLNPDERYSPRAIRAALQKYHDSAFEAHAQGVPFVRYQSRALGR
jgi:hypothetical protein